MHRPLLAGLARDLRAALRGIARAPAFSAVVVVTLALGIGANTAMFSVVDAVLLEPLPYPEPERLARIFAEHGELGIDHSGVSSGDVVEWRRRGELLDGIGAWYTMGRTLSAIDAAEGSADGAAQPSEIVNVAQVSEDFFPVLGVRPALGRTFTAEETAAATFSSAASPTGADPVTVLSHRAWTRRFGADPEVVGRTLVLERRRWRVVGVMPAGFGFPDPDVELWIPWSFEGERPHDQRYLSAITRLPPDVGIERAEAHLDALAAALAEELPESNQGWGVTLEPLREHLVGEARATLLVLLGAVALVLLVACTNLACLQLARVAARRRELTVRMLLGASRLRVARQLVVENLALAVLGGLAAVAVAAAALRVLGERLSPAVPRLDATLGIDGGVLAATAVASVGAALAFALLPLAAGALGGATALAETRGRAELGGGRGETLRRGLVVAELAMAVLLLAVAGLLVRSFGALAEVDVGFEPERVAVLPITLDQQEYRTGGEVRAYYDRLFERLLAVPGVESVGAATALPMSPIGPDFSRPIWAEGTAPAPGGARQADVRMVTPGYLETLGIPVVRGRPFDRRDAPDAPRVVLVNERLAATVWPGEDAVGRHLVVDYASAGTYPYEVVGVVGDVRFHGRRSEPRPEVFFPHAQRSYLILNVAVRTAGDPAPLLSDLRAAVLEVDPVQPAYRVAPLAELVAASIARERLATTLVGGFGVVGLALALVGIFGVLQYQVTRRVPELGLRAALGATRRELVGLILGSGLRLTLLGVGAGVLAAVGVGRLISSVLFRVDPLDPATFAAVVSATVACALVACWLPARRTARVDPVVALRGD